MPVTMRTDGRDDSTIPEGASLLQGKLWLIANGLASHLEKMTRDGSLNMLGPGQLVEMAHAAQYVYWLARYAETFDVTVQNDKDRTERPWENHD